MAQAAMNADIPEKKYEYLDHTADVHGYYSLVATCIRQVLQTTNYPACKELTLTVLVPSIWGDSLKEAFEQVVTAMFEYMTTDYDTVEMLEEQEIEAEADDLENLLFHFMDEWLFIFSADPFFIPRKVVITEFDLENLKIKSVGYGEEFDIKKHPQGTEVKAITYSNMQIYDEEDQHEVFVIIDI